MAGHVVCGAGETIITIYDYGDGTCAAKVSNFVGESQGKPCDRPLFESNCVSLHANLELVAQNNATGSYTGPQWDRWLSLMGLNGTTIVKGDLTITLDHRAGTNPIPPPVSPHFLPHLQAITGTLSAFEVGGGKALTSVPGFLSILYAQDSIFLGTPTSVTSVARCGPNAHLLLAWSSTTTKNSSASQALSGCRQRS